MGSGDWSGHVSLLEGGRMQSRLRAPGCLVVEECGVYLLSGPSCCYLSWCEVESAGMEEDAVLLIADGLEARPWPALPGLAQHHGGSFLLAATMAAVVSQQSMARRRASMAQTGGGVSFWLKSTGPPVFTALVASCISGGEAHCSSFVLCNIPFLSKFTDVPPHRTRFPGLEFATTPRRACSLPRCQPSRASSRNAPQTSKPSLSSSVRLCTPVQTMPAPCHWLRTV